jgi:phosphotriesterase-related protein
MGMINSVTGPISPSSLGFTLMHEHLVVKPQIDDPKYEPYTLDNPAKSTVEAIEFKTHGGKTILEMTPINYGRDVDKLQKIAKASKTNILFTTGFHKQEFMPEYVTSSSVEDLTKIILAEINNGVGIYKLKPAVIKCGSSLGEITDNEKKCIMAAAEAHKISGLPISTHCDKGTMAKEQLEILIASGVKPANVLLGHVDIPEDIWYLMDLCKTGVNIEIDHVGRDLADKDSKKIGMISELIKAGYLSQLFISGDMGKKDYLYAFGGKPGLTYFRKDFKDWCSRTIGDRNYDRIFVDNPKRFLSGSII